MVIVAGHGPFTWGKSALDAVHYAAALEEVARMAILTYQVNPSAGPLPEHVMRKHYERKHGPGAYYGQLDHVGSTKSLTHDGGGDTQAIAEMVKYTVTKYSANSNRVYATGDSSGGMMTEALLAVYPDIFKAGSSFAGVPAGCWSLGWTAASNWGGTCAGSGTPAVSSVNETAVQWGDKVRAMDPGYSGHRPRAQLFHGDQDQYVAYTNLREGIKEWTNVLSLSTDPTSTDTGLTLGSPATPFSVTITGTPATRAAWRMVASNASGKNS
jgi:hypothetical protein